MRVVRLKRANMLAAKPCRQAIDQETNLLFFAIIGPQSRCFGLRPLHARRGEPHTVEAEAGIEGIGKRLKFLAEEAVDDRGVAGRLACFDRDSPNLSIGAKELCLKATRALAMALQNACEGGC
jgi:hypothetical protein